MTPALAAFAAFIRRCRHSLGDRGGVAAIEFAFILPAFAVILFGAVEIATFTHVNRRVTATVSAVADLTSRVASVKASDVSAIFDASSALIEPFTAANLTLRVSDVYADAAGVVRVRWSQGRGVAPLVAGTTVAAVPAGLLSAGQTLILAEVQYQFEPVTAIIPPQTLSDVAFYRPRRTDEVTFTAG